MPTRNRGKQPNDDKDFAKKWHTSFTNALDDFAYLLSKGYANNSILDIVGSRYKLNKRQRGALLRASANPIHTTLRQSKEVKDITNKVIEIDGFNLLILLESALSEAYILKARDGLYRDISSIHGSYKRVRQTEPALILVGQVLKSLNVKAVKWYFDEPVSNSHRLKTMLLEISKTHDFNWAVELFFDPDKVLVKSNHIVVSSDGWVLNHAAQWFNLGSLLIEKHITQKNVLFF